MPTDLYTAADIPGNVFNDVVTFNGIAIREVAGRDGSDGVSSARATRTFLIQGSSDPITCREALINGPILIDNYDGLARTDITRRIHGPKSWLFTVSYSDSVPEAGGYTVSIDTNGGQILQTYGYAQQSFAAPSQTAPDFGKAIDVQDGKPQGIQRVIPALKINIRAKIAADFIESPIAYAKVITNVTGTVNSASIFDFAAGELLFTGASGDIVGEEPTLSYTFLASPNVTGLTIGDITGINKQGHEYIWYLFKKDKDATTKVTTSAIRAAYVGRVYGEADHSVLRIGDTA